MNMPFEVMFTLFPDGVRMNITAGGLLSTEQSMIALFLETSVRIVGLPMNRGASKKCGEG